MEYRGSHCLRMMIFVFSGRVILLMGVNFGIVGRRSQIKILKSRKEFIEMNDAEIKEVCMRLDEVLKKLYEKAKPMGCYDILADYKILERISLLEKMIGELWVMEIEHELETKDLKIKIDSLEGKLEKSNLKKIRLEEEMRGYDKKIREMDSMEKMLAKYKEENINLREELAAFTSPQIKNGRKGNQNACRKDINEVEVYRMIKLEGKSIAEVARIYKADRKTIKKYFIAGENYYLNM